MERETLVQLISQRVIAELQQAGITILPEPPPVQPLPAVTPASIKGNLQIPIGVSVRHLHICREHLDILYGPGYQLTKRNELTQPGQFAANEVVTVIGPKLRALIEVRILGPLRDQTQVELARTDAIPLGIDPPVAESVLVKGGAGVVLVGPKGSVRLNAVIRSSRHIHMPPDDAQRLGVKDREYVRVRIPGETGVIFDNVLIRVNPEFRLELHLDTDDANAAGVHCGSIAEIMK
ncbi:MAG: phosphate propanoyltransferase [bacterium]|nr:phosphate propanoyltransferase [bacterium]